MVKGNKGKGQRPRVSFDAEDTLIKYVKNAAKERGETVKKFLSDTIHFRRNPTFQFVTPAPSSESAITIESLLSKASDIVLVGFTLENVPKLYKDVLHEAALKRTPMSFVFVDPNLEEGHFVHQQLQHQLRNPAVIAHIQRTLRETRDFFLELRASAGDYGTTVRIFAASEIPKYGMVITNQATPHPQMRVNFYGTVYLRNINPYMDIQTDNEEGMAAYRTFYTYLEELTGRAREIKD